MTHLPRLDYASDAPTIESLHLLLQLIGKLPLRLHPWLNHGWHVALRMTPRGAITRSLAAQERQFTVELDFLQGALQIACDTGGQATLAIAEKPIAQVQRELCARLAELDLPAPLYGAPNELPNPIAFAEDFRPRAWVPDTARRIHAAFLAADRNLNLFRAGYRGKTSPSHLFWGSFDLAVTRFSGRAAPPHPGGMPNLPDAVTREAYSHEVISAGFWLGNELYPQAAYYAYAYPTPAGLGDADVGPGAWNSELGEFLLPYATVCAASEPGEVVQAFLQATFAAAAGRMAWPADTTIAAKPTFGYPPA